MGKVDGREGGDQIQESLDTLDWAKDWHMQFCIKMCKVLGIGRNRDYIEIT